MARKLSLLFKRICLRLALAKRVQVPAGTQFSEIVKEAWSARWIGAAYKAEACGHVVGPPMSHRGLSGRSRI
jgi:hypothetical protein